MEALKALIDNTVHRNIRIKLARAILYAQKISEESWIIRKTKTQVGEYTLSIQDAAVKARIKFDLPEYLEPVLKELLVEHWNESEEYADHILGGVI